MGFGYGRTTYHGKNARDRITGKPARRTFSNTMVAHVWAQRTQTFGQSNNGNFYFEGDSLFSYGDHFLCGFLMERPKGEPVALLNGESYSVSTSGHMSDASGAVRHLESYRVPELTALREALPVLAEYAGKAKDFRKAAKAWSDHYRATGALSAADAAGDHGAACALSAVQKWLGSFDISEDSEVTSRDGSYTWTREGNGAAVRFVASLAGITAKEVAKVQAERRKRLADAKAAEAERELRQLLWEAEKAAALSDSDWLESLPRDGSTQWEPDSEETPRWRRTSKPYELKAAEEYSRKLFRMAKAAKAHGLPDVAATLRERRKLYLAHLAGRNYRIITAYRREAAATLAAWRRNPGKLKWRGSAGTSINIGFYRERTRARIIRIETENYYADNAAAARAYLERGEGERPDLSALAEGSPEHTAIAAEVKAERERMESAYRAWQADSSSERPPSDYFRALVNDSALGNAWTELREAEQREKAAKEAEEQREAREAWLAGSNNYWSGSDESGGAYMRIRGDVLETSQGAEVPLAHAIKAFRFIKLCRERGEGFKRNGRTIRVGHFQVDSIDPSGNFRAGCHSFSWPEVERVARLAGVFDAEPSAAAVETKEGVH